MLTQHDERSGAAAVTGIHAGHDFERDFADRRGLFAVKRHDALRREHDDALAVVERFVEIDARHREHVFTRRAQELGCCSELP